jgi:hypothetical protein
MGFEPEFIHNFVFFFKYLRNYDFSYRAFLHTQTFSRGFRCKILCKNVNA